MVQGRLSSRTQAVKERAETFKYGPRKIILEEFISKSRVGLRPFRCGNPSNVSLSLSAYDCLSLCVTHLSVWRTSVSGLMSDCFSGAFLFSTKTIIGHIFYVLQLYVCPQIDRHRT